MDTPERHDPDTGAEEEGRNEPRTESGSGELDEDALQKGQDNLDQAGGGH